MIRGWLLVGVVACSSSQRADLQSANRPPADAGATAASSTTDASIADAPSAPADAFVTTLVPPDAPPSGVRVIVTDSGHPCGYVLDRIYFAEGSSEIQPHQRQVANEMATMIACILKDGAITKLEVQGHADDKERDPLRVSEERAVRIANLLVEHGVPARLLKVVGYGHTMPIDRRRTAAARAKNRRVDFLILARKPED